MDQQEEGWPLGLQPLSLRLGLMRNLNSISFSTINTVSSRSTSITSSNFDSESFEPMMSHERNVTLGSFIGINRRSFRMCRRNENLMVKKGKNKTWFSLCTKPQLEVEKRDGSASLGMFLEMERKACNLHGSSEVQSGICHTNNNGHHGLPLIFQCIGGQVCL